MKRLAHSTPKKAKIEPKQTHTEDKSQLEETTVSFDLDVELFIHEGKRKLVTSYPKTENALKKTGIENEKEGTSVSFDPNVELFIYEENDHILSHRNPDTTSPSADESEKEEEEAAEDSLDANLELFIYERGG